MDEGLGALGRLLLVALEPRDLFAKPCETLLLACALLLERIELGPKGGELDALAL